jgi:hypothetical protein
MSDDALIEALSGAGIYRAGGVTAVKQDLSNLFYGATADVQLTAARKLIAAFNRIKDRHPTGLIQLANMFLNVILSQGYTADRMTVLAELLKQAFPEKLELGANVENLFSGEPAIDRQRQALNWIVEHGIYGTASRLIGREKQDETLFFFAQIMLKLVNIVMKFDGVHNATLLREQLVQNLGQKIAPEFSQEQPQPPVLSSFMYHAGDTAYDFFLAVERYYTTVKAATVVAGDTKGDDVRDPIATLLSMGVAIWPQRFSEYLRSRYAFLPDDVARASYLVSLAWGSGSNG